MIVYNTTNEPIVIVTKWKADPFGGLAIQQTTFMVMPNQGIDLAMIGLEQKSSLAERYHEAECLSLLRSIKTTTRETDFCLTRKEPAIAIALANITIIAGLIEHLIQKHKSHTEKDQ